MSEKKAIRQYREPAGGWGALRATGKALTEQGIPISGSATLLRMNQPEGFDCPGCAWPDPKHTSSFEFCENGAKAVAWEATAKRCTPDLFAAHTVSELESWDDFDLEMQGRLTHPMMYDASTDHYVPIEWDNAFALVAQHLRALPTPNAADFYVSGRASSTSSSRANTAPTTFPTAPTSATRPPASACPNPSASAKAQSCWRISTTPTRSLFSARTREPTAPG
jgi:anaerobic selenocysteine-containing dehydrogenase